LRKGGAEERGGELGKGGRKRQRDRRVRIKVEREYRINRCAVICFCVNLHLALPALKVA